jgi:hypothetical protein
VVLRLLHSVFITRQGLDGPFQQIFQASDELPGRAPSFKYIDRDLYYRPGVDRKPEDSSLNIQHELQCALDEHVQNSAVRP